MVKSRSHRMRKNKKTRRRRPRRIKGGGSKAVILVLHPTAGFFSSFFYTCRVYMYAKQNNLPFFIEHDKWQYTYKEGWHDYFTSLEDFKENSQYTELKRYRSHSDQEDLPQYSLREYIACIKEIFVLKDELKKRVDDFISQIGGDFTSLYIRRGDKKNEVELIPIDDILAQVAIKDDGGNIYLQTDDYAVVDTIKSKFPSCKVFTTTPENKHGANNKKMVNWQAEDRKNETEELLVAVSIFVRCKKGWTYYLSNVGTFHKLFGYDVVDLYVDSKHTKEYVEEKYSLDTVGNPYALL